MPDVGLPTGATRAPRGPGRGGRGFKRGGVGRGHGVGGIAHDITGKERTEDVVTGESRQKTFSDLLLSPSVLSGLQTAGFVQPSPVQLLAIPPAKVGFDLIVQSKSGTGKTCVYVVAALEMLKPDLQGLQALVLAPTREIAIQGVTVAMQVGQELGKVKMAAFIGGISLAEDKMKAKTCQLGVGTPGRLKQLISEGMLAVDSVRLVVLDEADKLLEPAFLADTTAILNMLPKSKQVIALSATYPDQLASLAERFMRSPQHIRPGQASQVLSGVAQFLYKVQHCPATARQTAIKQAALLTILSSVPYTQCLVFSNYSTIAQATADFLNSRGFPAIFISAGQDQSRRLAAMHSFKQFNCRILCSTDLTARGIDAENVNLVINMEVPWEQNTYLHRIGRGGRFGSFSLAVTLASEGVEVGKMRGMVKKTGSVVRILPLDLPRDIRGEMEAMQILEVEAEVEDGSIPDDVTGGGEEEITEEIELKNKKANNGKIKRRGKRKVDGESTDDALKESGVKTTESKNGNIQEDNTNKEKDIVRKFMNDSKQGRTLTTLPTLEDITNVANKISEGDYVGKKQDEEVVDSDEMENVGQAIIRLSARRREEYKSRVGQVMEKIKGRELDVLLEKLSKGDSFDDLEKSGKLEHHDDKTFLKTHSRNSTESESKNTSESESSSSSESESSSDQSTSDSDSSSDTDSESDSDVDESNDRLRHHGNVRSNITGHQPPAYHGYAYPYTPAAAAFPQPFLPLPTHPPPPGHPAGQAWYSQWAASVAVNRQTVQHMEYGKYMQYLAYCQARK